MGFRETPVPPTNTIDCHDITGILFKVALHTITLTTLFFIVLCTVFIPPIDDSRRYKGILMSVRHTFGFRIIIKVPINQIFSKFHTFLCTIKYRLSLITVYFTFTLHEL
jgi:hypothetical protein